MAEPQFTPKYIEMVQAAEEIQADTKGGEWWCRAHNESAYFHQEIESLICHKGTSGPWQGEYHEPEGRDRVWLPRLDQLLGMLGGPRDFLRWYIEPDRELDNQWMPYFGDWHELALAVVMREKFGKVWKDGQWLNP